MRLDQAPQLAKANKLRRAIALIKQTRQAKPLGYFSFQYQFHAVARQVKGTVRLVILGQDFGFF